MAVRLLLATLLLSAGYVLTEEDSKKPAANAERRDLKQDPKWVKTVHGAIDRGVKWLLSRQEHSGRFPPFEDSRGYYELGMHALATYTIIHGGHPLDSKETLRALRTLRKLYERHVNSMYTYEVGLVLLTLEAKYFAAPLDQHGKRIKRKKKPKISPEDRDMATKLAVWLQTKQQPGGLWRYPHGGQDLSNTQYAALGLWAAQRLGVPVNTGVIERMLDEVMARQQKGGKKVPFILDPKLRREKDTGERRSGTFIHARGWKYMPTEVTTTSDGKRIKRVYPYSGSMTSAGIAALAIGRVTLGKSIDKAQDRRLRRAMWEGLAWLQNNWDLMDNPGQPGNWPFYWLYGLERCARLSGVEFIGHHDWYVEGANRIMADQRANGSWPKRQRMRPPGGQNVRWWSDQVDTCFAVLFLARSTPEIKTPPPTITGG